ncbi:MAG TPA: ATP-binding protein, partial [Ktedonobacterales bacterium]|nr:ATP-binding protein [Ktedonobacterales bacterium]
KGPGETIHEYTLISRDEQRLLKNGEYVYYELDAATNAAAHGADGADGADGANGTNGAHPAAPRRVLGRILRRVPVQLFPDTFLSEPEVAPAQVAALVGYDMRASDLFELHVAIMGYYDEALDSFVNPWIPPSSGTPIYLAEDAWLATVLSRRQTGQTGSAVIGSLLTRPPTAVPVVLDVKELVSTHLAIIASTGAGKSYLASVIVEELMRPYNRAAVLIIDPHGEYNTLQEIANHDEFRAGAGHEPASPAARRQPRYAAQTRVYLHDQVKVRLNTLTLGDLRYLLPNMTDKQHHFLSRAYEALRNEKKGQPWGAADLKRHVSNVGKSANEDSGDDSGNSTIAALHWKIDERLGDNTMVFDQFQHLNLGEVLQPGQCTILQLNEIDERDQQVIVATLLRRINQARMDTEKGKVTVGDERFLPYPVFVLLEEAHHFAPHDGEAITTGILKQVLAEGRKFGIGVGLISQRPGKLDADVLSQCLTQCIMRIVNEVDQKSVATAVEGVGRDLLQNLPALSKGQAIIAGSAINTPVICRVRTRITPHGGESKDAPAEWLSRFSDDAVEARARDEALPRRNNKPFNLMR